MKGRGQEWLPMARTFIVALGEHPPSRGTGPRPMVWPPPAGRAQHGRRRTSPRPRRRRRCAGPRRHRLGLHRAQRPLGPRWSAMPPPDSTPPCSSKSSWTSAWTWLRRSPRPSTTRQPCSTHHVVVMGGTVPGHTTDAVAVELARAAGASTCIIATNVDRVYDADPREHEDAHAFSEMTIDELAAITGIDEALAPGASSVVDPIAVGHKRGAIDLVVLDGRDLSRLESALGAKPSTAPLCAATGEQPGRRRGSQSRAKPAAQSMPRGSIPPHAHCRICKCPVDLKADPRVCKDPECIAELSEGDLRAPHAHVDAHLLRAVRLHLRRTDSAPGCRLRLRPCPSGANRPGARGDRPRSSPRTCGRGASEGHPTPRLPTPRW